MKSWFLSPKFLLSVLPLYHNFSSYLLVSLYMNTDLRMFSKYGVLWVLYENLMFYSFDLLLVLNKKFSPWNAEQLPGEHIGNFDGGRAGNLVNEQVWQNQRNEHSEEGCMEHGICSHEVLHNGESDFSSHVADNNRMMKKVFFSFFNFCNTLFLKSYATGVVQSMSLHLVGLYLFWSNFKNHFFLTFVALFVYIWKNLGRFHPSFCCFFDLMVVFYYLSLLSLHSFILTNWLVMKSCYSLAIPTELL